MFRREPKHSTALTIAVAAQLLTFYIYLFVNIVTVGGVGVASEVLISHILIAAPIFLLLSLKTQLFFRLHLLLFLIFLLWLAIRVLHDLGSLTYLKELTTGTTGGMLLFYLLGAFLNASYVRFLGTKNYVLLLSAFVFLFVVLVLLMDLLLFLRLREDVFLVHDVNGAYQRAGNFLSIAFILNSFLFLALIQKITLQGKKYLRILFWCLLYFFGAALAIVGAQLFGSNSATVLIPCIFIITLSTALVSISKSIQTRFSNEVLILPLGRTLLGKIFKYGIVISLSFAVFLATFFYVTDLDVTKIRLFGFGAGSMTSLDSRNRILAETAIDQLAYAPIFGNMNVDYLTNNDGKTLHSFFLFIMANLGLIGLFIILVFIFQILWQLYYSIQKELTLSRRFGSLLILCYSFLLLLFLLLFANLTVRVNWPVLWFVIGLVSQPFGFKYEERTRKERSSKWCTV